MEFHHLILYAVVGWMLYTWGLPGPLKNFLWGVGDDFVIMCLWTVAYIIKECLGVAEFLNIYAQLLLAGWLPEMPPLHAVILIKVVHEVAYVFRLVGDRLLALCIKSFGHRYGDTLAAIAVWLAGL